MAQDVYAPLVNANTIAIINGGFFGYGSNWKEQPIGLVRSKSQRLNAWMEWRHGGVLVSDDAGTAKIIPAPNAKYAGAWREAIQSKPIIINSGKVDVGKNQLDSKFNRVAIGFTLDGDILIVGKFQSFGQAATLVDFANTYNKIAKEHNLNIHRALAMDGGSGAQIYIPSISKHFGDSGRSFFPNAVRLDATEGRKQ